MPNTDTLNAMNADAKLLIIREKYTFIFWIALSSGIGAFAIYKFYSNNK